MTPGCSHAQFRLSAAGPLPETTMEELVQSVDAIRASRVGVIAAYCITVYEWLDGLPAEVELIHPSRWSSVKIAYLLCRYYPLLVWAPLLYAYLPDHSAETCHDLTHIVNALLVPLQVSAPGVMLMRAYAFAGRHIPILSLLLVFYLVLIALNIWFLCFDISPVPDMVYTLLGGTGCFPDYSQGQGGMRLVIALCASTLMDLISLTVIAIYCLRTHSTRGTLGRLSAFIFISAIHAATLVVYFRTEGAHNGIGLPYALTLSNIVACRLVLDLRRKALPTETEIRQLHSQIVDHDLWLIEEPADPDPRPSSRQPLHWPA
ncbi:hypothetical protein MKEN_00871700 [Mycena kentingensis (nom. inval.)]|nr:hypothetical protein MKEN_00871700 [Mycena kentingensis (nom. inval.)]